MRLTPFVDPVTGEIQTVEALSIYPARHFVTPEERLEAACNAIEQELQSQRGNRKLGS